MLMRRRRRGESGTRVALLLSLQLLPVNQLECVRRDVLPENLSASPRFVESEPHIPVGLSPRHSCPVNNQLMDRLVCFTLQGPTPPHPHVDHPMGANHMKYCLEYLDLDSAPVNTKEEALLCVSTDSVFAAQRSQGLSRRRYDQGALRKMTNFRKQKS